MRTAFIDTLMDLAAKDKRIFLLTGDLGYSVLEPFEKKFPNNFLNVGVAEQNMVGIAAGLAMSGKIPIVYSICTFATLRPFEFIRNDVCFQNLNVKIIGVGAGLSYSQYAATHQSLDDIAVMRSLTNMTILNPGDPKEAKLAATAALRHKGPVYLRIGKKGEPDVHKGRPKFKIGKGILVCDGKDITVIATGNILENTHEAVKILAGHGVSVRFLSMPTVMPLDKEIILSSAKKTKAVFTVEENFIVGGLGDAVAEVLASSRLPKVNFNKIAIEHQFPSEVGSQKYLREIYGLSPQKIALKIKSLL